MRFMIIHSVILSLGLSAFLVLPHKLGMAATELDVRSNGPAIGTSVGTLFSVKDQSGKIRTFKSLHGERGLIVLFSHSFDW